MHGKPLQDYQAGSVNRSDLASMLRRWWEPESIDSAIALNIDKAILENIHMHVMRVPISVMAAAALVAGMAAQSVPAIWPLMWFAAISVFQIVRFLWIRKLSSVDDDNISQRLSTCVHLFFYGSCLFALSACFIPFADESYLFVLTIVMIGLVVGGIATLNGYPPLHFSIAVPNIGAIMLGWIITGPDGGGYWVHYSMAALLVLLVSYLFSFSRDTYRAIATMQVMNAELQKALDSARTANEARSHFFRVASHDLNQPLQSISLMTHNLANRDLGAENQWIIDSIGNNVSVLTQELDMLLDISELDSDHFSVNNKRVDLAPVLAEVADLYRPMAAEKGLALVTLLDSAPDIESDQVLLTRLFRNLVDNAVKYTNEGTVTIKLHTSEGLAIVEIEDTGIGIDEKDQQLIFTEFYQKNNPQRDRQKGLGLGLSAAQRIVPLLDAVMTIESTLNSGSCFRVEFAAVQPRDAAETTTGSVGSGVESRGLSGKSVLLIEGDEILCDATTSLLESWNMAVVAANDWHSVSDLLDQKLPDLIICDLQLPGEDGYEIANALKISRPHIPLILLADENSIERGGVDSSRVLSKPVDVSLLQKEITAAVV
ncbi:hypothetical protein AB833_23895 [Chromatiales bacterium (ex Bugula neritina AB1)]|nr:hypothetical protein AB833_23895 [Chromatiales bacterium (ex Bugula neritina AB1)]